MRKTFSTVSGVRVLSLLVASLATSSVVAQSEDTYFIKVTNRSAIRRLIESSQTTSSGAFANIDKPILELSDGSWFKVTTSGSFESSMLKLAKQNPDIVAIEKNSKVSIDIVQENTGIENFSNTKPQPQRPRTQPVGPDPKADSLWAQPRVHAELARKEQLNKVTVAMVDTGVDYNHEDLAGQMWLNTREIPGDGIDNDHNGYVDDVIGWDFIDNDNLPYDLHMHGTHTSGIVGALSDNSIGVRGMARYVNLMAVRMMDATGNGSTEASVNAIKYAADNGASIISASWGDEVGSELIRDAIRYAGSKDVLYVASAGNKWSNADASPHYPACYSIENMIAVAASDEKDEIPLFSNFGPTTIQIAAPGTNILSTTPNNNYDKYSGTSMAAPQVSGAAALLRAAFPSLSAVEIKQVLMDSVDVLPAIEYRVVSNGRLNVQNAFELAKQWVNKKRP